MPRYRVILRATSHVRLIERPGDAVMTWVMKTGELDGSAVGSEVRDLIEKVNGAPVHRGLEIQVVLDAADLETAVQTARLETETTLIFIAASARAPVGEAHEVLAYEITPGSTEQELAQWFSEVPISAGQRPLSQELFAEFFRSAEEGRDERLQWRLALSQSWHRAGLEEAEAITRFLFMWIAFEAVGPCLADAFEVDAKGFGAHRELARRTGESREFITELLGLRRDLFHARRVLPASIRARAAEYLPRLEALLVTSWIQLMGISSDAATQFPAESVTPYPTQIRLRATLAHQDATTWTNRNHPHFEGTITQRRIETDDPRDVQVEYPQTVTLRNADRVTSVTVEIWGAQGIPIKGGEITFGSTIRTDQPRS